MSTARALSPDPIVVVRGWSAEKVIAEVLSGRHRHVVQEDGLSFDSELALAQAMQNDPRSFLSSPLSLILGVQDTSFKPEFDYKFAVGTHKDQVLKPLEEYLGRLPKVRGIRDEALMIADELYTNGAKTGMSTDLRFAERRVLREGQLEFMAHADERRLVLVCRDTYGSLDVDRIMQRISACFEKGVAQSIHHGTGGAGIGSFMVFNAAASYYAGVDKGKCTVVGAALPLGLSRREISELPKNVHLLSVLSE